MTSKMCILGHNKVDAKDRATALWEWCVNVNDWDTINIKRDMEDIPLLVTVDRRRQEKSKMFYNLGQWTMTPSQREQTVGLLCNLKRTVCIQRTVMNKYQRSHEACPHKSPLWPLWSSQEEEWENKIETYHDHPVGCSLASNLCEQEK